MKKKYQHQQALLEQENENLKRINIFVTKEDYKKLLDLKYKYRLSFGYLVRIIAQQYMFKEATMKACMEQQYYNTQTMRKTSLKTPKNGMFIEYTPKFYNNAIIMYLNKYDKNLLNDKDYQKVRNEIINVMQNTIDPLYDWDKYARYQYRLDKLKERL